MEIINFSDFEKVDIRIGTVIKAEVPTWSHWVMRFEVDLGDEIGIKKCFSGLSKFFKPEDVIGKQFPFVVNLEPRKIGPDKELSEVMMIMVVPSESEDVAPILFSLLGKVEDGTKVR